MLALVFEIGTERVALDVRRIREVVPCVPLRSLAGSPPWLAGAFVYRGGVVPVIDLPRLAGLGDCPPRLSSRIILVTHPGDESRLLGLLATQVSDLQTLECDRTRLTHWNNSDRVDLGPILADNGKIVRLLDVERLLANRGDDTLLRAAEVLP